MPELPEVETVRRGLSPAMEGAVIVSAQVNRPDLRWPFPERMSERLTGARVLGLRRRSKYLLADLDSGETLLVCFFYTSDAADEEESVDPGGPRTIQKNNSGQLKHSQVPRHNTPVG